MSRIAGTGRYLPARVLTNHDLERMVDTSDAWIVERTGIRERRIAADGEHTSDMAAAAAREALASAGLSARDLDLILVATVTPDMPLPATAMFVQQKIGARNDCPGFDLSAACAGFIYGLAVADQFVRGGAARHVLVVGVELLSRVLDWTDRSTCVLFGDGAGAVVVSPALGDGRGILSTTLYADGSLAPALCIPAGGSVEPATAATVAARRHFVRMEGSQIFKFAVRALAQATRTAIERAGVTPEEIEHVVPHQANLRILAAVAERCGIPWERFHLNIDRYGNTSSASVPIALDEAMREGRIRPGALVAMCALGGGIAWGGAVVRM
ncbi:MAG: ketoacyl-ACP synthase III [Myxococcota bacterium]|nr:ketoacyl-ACP synthase III [Myxococcota bacterium]